MFERIRRWLVKKIVGDRSYALNLNIKGTFSIPVGREAFIYRCLIETIEEWPAIDCQGNVVISETIFNNQS